MVLFAFLENDVTCMAYKISGATGVLGLEVIKAMNCILHFICAHRSYGESYPT